MALLSLQGVTLNLGGKTLLDTADLHVEQGERVCLVGRNGVGKSSLMALLSGDLTPDGGTIVLRAYEKGEWFVFEVEDNGMGISAEDLPYIFQRFYRAEKSRDRATGGSGLGLAITKGYVEAHGGTIEVQSALGRGTTFTVQLPRYDEEAETAEEPIKYKNN